MLEKEFIRWVEYSLCEEALEIYPKSKSHSITFHSFCERISESISRGNLSKRETNILNIIMDKANKQYSLSDEEIGEICANFFMDKNWSRYTRPIELMKNVNWRL